MAKNNDDILRFKSPSEWQGESWREGLFLGNGKTAANVFGGAVEEKILINDSSLFWQGKTTVLPDVSALTDETKKLIENGEYLRAQKVLTDALEQRNFRPQADCLLPLGLVGIKFFHNDTVTDFSRSLDMASGQATVTYTVGETDYRRDIFVSRADDAVVCRLSKKGNDTISAEFSVSRMPIVNAFTPEGICKMPTDVSVVCDRQFYCFAARNDDECSDYGLVAKVSALGGSVRAVDNKIVISRAQSVLVEIKTFVDSSREKQFVELKTQLAAMRDGYEKMFKTHKALHAKLYQSASVSLCVQQKDVASENLLDDAKRGGISPLLAEKAYKFARYITVSSMDGDGKTITPVGLWNGSYKPQRAYKCYNGELQTAYMHTFVGNLSQNLEKSFDFYVNNTEDFRNNAQRLFGARGIVVPVVAAPKTGRPGSVDVYALHFCGCASYVAQFYFKYVKYTQNYKFLRQKLFPFMKEAARFYEDYLTDVDGTVEFCPSVLPMRVGDSAKYQSRPIVAKNGALDIALVKNLLENLLEACRILGVKERKNWRVLLSKLPEKQVDDGGVFKEFCDNVVSADYTGISCGTLYEAYFGDEISFMSAEERKQVYLNTANKKRLPSAQNSFGTLVLGAVYARLGEGNLAKRCLSDATNGCMTGNLSFADTDWRGMGICGSGDRIIAQLYSNFVFAHVVQQMLIYCNDDLVKIFPALPTDWKNVEFQNFATESGATVSAKYNGEKNTMSVSVCCKKQTSLILVLPDFAKKITKHNLPEKPHGREFALSVAAGKEVTIQIKCSAR